MFEMDELVHCVNCRALTDAEHADLNGGLCDLCWLHDRQEAGEEAA